MAEDNKELDFAFSEAIRKHPLEARSHFEIVDPAVWKIFPAGKGNISAMQRLGWSGPFGFSVSGQDFEAFGRKGNGSDNLKFSVIKAYKMFKRAKDAGFMNKDLQLKISVCEKMIMEQAAVSGL